MDDRRPPRDHRIASLCEVRATHAAQGRARCKRPCEAKHDGLADSAIAACDDGDFAFQRHGGSRLLSGGGLCGSGRKSESVQQNPCLLGASYDSQHDANDNQNNGEPDEEMGAAHGGCGDAAEPE